MSDRIERRIELAAPLSRVWRALTDAQEFGQWFGVKPQGPFVVGQVTRGPKTRPCNEHLMWEVVVQKMEHELLFSFTWHPYASESNLDAPAEASTLVEFRLEKTAGGTLLVVTESGFDKISPQRRLEALRLHQEGWDQQIRSIERHVASGT